MVSWTAHAKNQLKNIHNLVKCDSPLYAQRVAESFIVKTLGLDDFPRRGCKVPELNDDSVREISNYSYRIIYEIQGDQVEVLAVIHKRQEINQNDIFQ